MFSKTIIAALAASTLVSAHGKVASIQGNAGGNGTALAIQGGVVPGPGRNRVTEVDTTVFKSTDIMTDGLGRTTGQGKNTVDMIAQSMDLSGSTLPQVSSVGGSLSGVLHVVTTDGAGPFEAVVDPTATGQFSQGIKLTATTQVPGNNGNIRPNGQVPRSTIFSRAAERVRRGLGIEKRAQNVNQDFPMAFSVPDGTTCTGTINGIQNVCLAKIANNNRAGPFGGVVPFQIVDGSATAPAAPATSSAIASTKSTSGSKGSKNARRAIAFRA